MIDASRTDIRQRNAIVLAVFVVSAAGLAFEIALTRLFSLFYQYHFAFLAVSLAVLGLSLGASAGHFIRQRRAELLVYALIALGAAFPIVTVGLSWYPSAASIVPRAVLAIIPFALIGLFSALAFERYARISGTLYAADLIGAAAGVGLVLLLLHYWSAFSMILCLGPAISATAVIIAALDPDIPRVAPLRRAAIISGGIGLALLAANLAIGAADYHPELQADAPRDKTMLAVLADPRQGAHITSTEWSPFARVDVVETNDPSARFVFTDAGAGSYMLAFDGSLDPLRSWQETIEYLPFTTGETARTLVIGAGGGKDIILALLGGAQSITAVEVNPAVVAVTRRAADYNGNILDRPQVTLVEGDARAFVERDTAAYDLIYLNVVYTQAVEPGSQVLVENYVFTWQAFEAYLNRLAPGGRLAVVSHNALEASRAAVTALRALEANGVPPAEALDHLMLWMFPASDLTLRTSVLIVGRQPLQSDVIEATTRNARQLGMQGLFVPGEFEVAFAPLRNGMSLADFTSDDADYNLTYTGDDSPYFFHLDLGLPRPVQSALATTLVAAAGLTALAFLVSGDKAGGDLPSRAGSMAYAMVIGAGFMLIEIPLIQRFQLLLGYPILSLALVLGTLLLAGGVGSWISQKWEGQQLPRCVMIAALWIALLGAAYRFVLPSIAEWALPGSLALRITVVIALTVLLGLPMGVLFPSLIRRVGQHRNRVALIWALNGVFSTLGSVLALVISMTWGFSVALLAGAALYAVVALLSRTALKEV